jgi:hypothetical protein
VASEALNEEGANSSSSSSSKEDNLSFQQKISHQRWHSISMVFKVFVLGGWGVGVCNNEIVRTGRRSVLRAPNKKLFAE